MAKTLMIQGTGSGAGKSLIVAAFCRIFSDMGMRVVPFKGQNMALNSCITAEGGEIGRAQALQAEAARIEPTVDMNPVLLKVSGDTGSQVIIHGKVYSNMTVKEYYAFKKRAWHAVTASFDRISKKHELIVIEGAGSPAEINLMHGDIVNMAVARYAKAPVILVGDIDKGGVFASLYGTVKLLGRDSRHIRGFLINKFRGDIDILRPGLEMLKEKTNKPVIGILPYIFNIDLPEEDGLVLQHQSSVNSKRKGKEPDGETIKIVVVRLKYISNFTDFDPFLSEPGIKVVFSHDRGEIENADVIIIPGSKNTVKDLFLLRKLKIDESIKRAYSRGAQVIGICGGYQMLGRKMYDPDKVESSRTEMEGIGLLNIETTMAKTKTTCQVEAEIINDADFGTMNAELKNPKSKNQNPKLRGYEIHMGTTKGDIGIFRLKRLSKNSAPSTPHSAIELDGSRNNNCWGTYIHGIFDNDDFRLSLINDARTKKGLSRLDSPQRYSEMKEQAIDRLAGIVKSNIDMEYVKRIIGL